MNTPSGNVGEWSELYTLAFLLVNGGAYAADKKQNRIQDTFYKVLEIYLAGRTPSDELKYEIQDNTIHIHSSNGNTKRVERSDISVVLTKFFNDLSNEENTRTFPLGSGSELMNLLSKTFIAASSNQTTSDLELIYEENKTLLPSPRIGFSIKSQLGSASTLLNASGSTNFTFRVIPPSTNANNSFPELKQGAVKANVARLIEEGFQFQFVGIDSENFHSNLELIDSSMPDYLSQLLLAFYGSKSSNVKDISGIAFPEKDQKSSQKLFKVKQFLGAVAMGLRPTGYWDGDVTKFKGLIVVKIDGDVVFYYLYNLTDFQEFLFDSVKFEVASTTRHKFGEIYSQSGEHFMKLNLQIRFIK
jgi:hypothetical protein